MQQAHTTIDHFTCTQKTIYVAITEEKQFFNLYYVWDIWNRMRILKKYPCFKFIMTKEDGTSIPFIVDVEDNDQRREEDVAWVEYKENDYILHIQTNHTGVDMYEYDKIPIEIRKETFDGLGLSSEDFERLILQFERQFDEWVSELE